MARKFKYWLAAASVLLMVGAGCETGVQQSASVETGAESGAQAPSEGAGADIKVEAKTGVEADADATVDAALKEVDDETAASMEENADANVVNNDNVELNAYGQAYDQSQL